jgi:Zn-dependent metalloprotease
MKSFLRAVALMALYCITFNDSYAQILDTVDVRRKEDGKIRYARLKRHEVNSIKNSTAIVKLIHGASDETEFRIIKESVDNKGYEHKKFQQYFKGILVENGIYLVHGRNGIVEDINGDFFEVKVNSIIPKTSESQALKNAITFVGSKRYKWQDSLSEKFIKEVSKNDSATYFPTGRLVIVQSTLNGGNQMVLAWKFQISSKQPDNEEVVYVDANNGRIVKRLPLIYDTNVDITAETRYSGIKTITGDSYSGGYRLKELRNGVDIQTRNLQNTSNLPGADVTNGSSTSFTSGNWSSFTSDRQALDVHWASEKVYDFWQNVFSRNSIDGNGLRMLSLVHWGSNTNNANWIGNTNINPNNNNYIRLGDGDGSMANPFVSLDVVAHEFGHGISQFTGLGYDFTETGAINEGISDIWAACIEYWVDPSKQTWKLGEEIMANGAPCMRSLANPKTGGYGGLSATGGYPNTYKGEYWDKGGETHTNSTVMSHWFYLLVNGGSGTNDLFNGYNLTGIGISAAQSILYKTQTDYLAASPQYMDMRTATILAAQALYGSGSCAEIAVTNAWYAVGVGALYTSSSTPIISGPNFICSSENYTVSNIPSGGTVSWSISNSYNASISASGNTATISKINSGVTSIMVSVSGGCNIFTNKTVTLGTPTMVGGYVNSFNNGTSPLGIYPYVSNDACMGYYINTSIALIGSNTTTWSKVSSSTTISWNQTGDNLKFYLPADGSTALFEINSSNSCGTTTKQFEWIASNCAGTDDGCMAFSISPNPSNGIINVSTPSILPPCNGFVNGVKLGNRSDMVIHEIRILDNLKNVRKVVSGNKGKQMSLSLSNLVAGIYYVQVIGTNKYMETKQVFIQR